MRLYFGLSLQDGVLPAITQALSGVAYLGPRQCLLWLEDHLGLRIPETDVDHLRIEQYRQALKQYLQDYPAAFFAASFAADDLGTAAALLARRDELLLAGWDFKLAGIRSERLQVLATIETYWTQSEQPLHLYPGEADRLAAVLAQVQSIPLFLHELHLCDERSLFPPFWQRFLQALSQTGIPIIDPPTPPSDPTKNTDLSNWQAFLRGEKTERPKLQGDGSLLLLSAFRETHLAAYLAQLLRLNPAFRPSVLLPQANRTLDNALSMEGLPSLGVPSASLARPSLQVLKLAPAFLWDPIDPYKIMEFVSLTVKPLEAGLAQRIAAFLADTPGLFSGRWYGMIDKYFEEELPHRLQYRPKTSVEDVKQEYHFWFKRQRVDSRNDKIDKSAVKQIYAHLQQWASDLGREENAPTLLVLAAQSRKIVELLDALPEEQLGYLELERIVRTIYEPAPLKYRNAEAQRLHSVQQTGAVIGPVPELVWWDFFEREPDYFFSRWYPQELKELRAQGIDTETPEQQNNRLVAQRQRPIIWTQERMILCQPDFCEGQAVQLHPLLGDLMAAFGEDLSKITLHIDQQETGQGWEQAFQLPQLQSAHPAPLPKPEPFLQVRPGLLAREMETPTSLESLLYYPYQWVFKHHIQLRSSGILSVVEDFRLLGNLAHRLLEKLLAQNFKHWSRQELDEWVTVEIPELLQKEGATLLMYGREPERIAFTKHVKFAAWSLISLLKQNNWAVLATEHELNGKIDNLELKGRADLVLQRGNEHAIIDLKWRGTGRFTNMLSSEEDIQLAIYSRLLPPTDEWAHTAYFIIDKGRMLVRNNQAFQDIQTVKDEVDHQEVYNNLLQRLVKTYHWRLAQLEQGQVEVRCEQTNGFLEEHYAEELLQLLEMKNANAWFDDYDVLIGLVN